ncbi:hypothetical protein COJ27_26020 [Bacillus cereus]|uniref:hypothetical protein n=1 Tax=Bacillus cereus TaxID=1396 RepID=UPI000BF6F5EA|nr:hypothetical protein [Bacillus cereus]PFL58907.1 hypothetical protein COJ27_26020 [Bacillus cereus]
MNYEYTNNIKSAKPGISPNFYSSDLVRMNEGKFVAMIFDSSPSRKIYAFIHKVYADNPPGEAVFEYVNISEAINYPVLHKATSSAVLDLQPISFTLVNDWF